MLRTTISRIRRVCSPGYVPRVLRDDFCNGPASYAVIRKAHKSTKSTDDGPGPTEKDPDLPTLKTISNDTTTGIPLTHREKCQRIIDQAFGTGSTEPDRMSNEQYCSHTVNIEATRREIQEAENERIKLQKQNMKIENPLTPDDSQYGILRMSPKLTKVGDDEDEIIAEENTTKKEPSTDALTQKEALYQTLAVNKELGITFKSHNTDGLEPNLNCAEVDHKLNINSPGISDTVGNNAELDDADAENPAVNPDHTRVLNVTTAKEIEEKLAQKLETIEETPLVEAQRPGIEGFNVNPKVLEDQLNPELTCESIYKKQDNSQEEDLHGTYDEVAKRCLNHPIGQIDEMLIKEIDKIGVHLTCEPGNKTPSTLMGDELGQMDLCNENKQQKHQEICSKSAESEDQDEESGNMFITSPSSTHYMFSQLRLPDLNEQAEEMTLPKSHDIEPLHDLNEQAEEMTLPKSHDIEPLHDLNEQAEEMTVLNKSEDIEPMKEDGVPNPDQIKKEIKPVSCDNNPTAKLSCHHTTPPPELVKHLDEMEEDLHILPQFGYLQPNVQQPVPNVMPSDIESMQELHLSIYKRLSGKYSPLNDRNVVVKNTEVENGTPHTAETVKPAINPTNVSSDHPVSHGSGNIGAEWPCKSGYNCNYNGVRRPSHYGTINGSDLAELYQRLLAEREYKNKNKNLRYLGSTYAWGQTKETSATKARNDNELHFNESDEVECHSRTPEFQPKTMEDQAVLDERRNAANRLVEGVPYTKTTLPGQKWDRNIDNSLNEDKVIQPCSNKFHSDEDSECKLNLKPEKVTLPEELMKEHELDPYYVLTCNETCPISPASMSVCRNSDFVDTSETVYMKKNICESARPKQSRDNVIVPFENVMAERPKVDDKSLMLQSEYLTADTKAQANDKINISDSVQPKLDGTHLVSPQCENEPADTQEKLQLHKISEVDCELIPETTPEIEDLPNIKPTVVSPEHPSLRSSQQVTLTELLKRVRERNRTQCTSDLGVKVDPTKGTCKKSPHCQPTGPRSPPANPIPPPSFGLPMVKRRPKVCVPKKKGGGSKKCAACDIDVTCGVQLGEICPDIAYELNETEGFSAISMVDLTEVVLDHIQTLGKMVGGVLQQVISNVETLLAREYDPWAPIPSWPIPKKGENKCDKPCNNWTPGISGAPPCVRGCPVSPKARASMNPAPPCNLKPCEGFPKRSFSALDCFAVFLGKNKVYPLGPF